MSNLNSLPSTSRQAKSPSKFMSLADILQAKANTSGVKTRSGGTLQLQLDLHKKLEGLPNSNSKLNFSAAFNRGATDSFNFVDTSAETNNHLETDKAEQNSSELNKHILNEKLVRPNRRHDGKYSKKDDKSMNYVSSTDPLKNIQSITGKIDNKDARFDFDDKDKNLQGKTSTPDFHLVQLPKGFSLERGRVNVYRSGIIEIVSNENPARVMRFKKTVHHSNNIFADLVIATDSQTRIEQSNILSPESFS